MLCPKILLGAGITIISTLLVSPLPENRFWVENSNMKWVYGFGTGYQSYLQDAVGEPIVARTIAFTIKGHNNGGAYMLTNTPPYTKVYGQDTFGSAGWQKTSGKTGADGSMLAGAGYGNPNVFMRACDYSSSPVCNPPLPGNPTPLVTSGGTGYDCSVLDIEIAFKKLGKVLSQSAYMFVELVDGSNIQCQWWYSADASVNSNSTSASSSAASNRSIAVSSTATLTVIPTLLTPRAFAGADTDNVVDGPPQAFDISSVNGWCQWVQGCYVQRLCLIPESFDGDEDNKPYRTLDQCSPYVYVETLPGTDDNQCMIIYSLTDSNTLIASTNVTMHKQGSKFVSDYIVPTDEPNYSGTIVGESGQTYKVIFVEDGCHLTIQPFTQPPTDVVNFTDFSREAASYETVDSVLPFFGRYLKNKYTP